MRYVIGVDGGQTNTTAVVADETGCLLGIGQGGPANHIHEPGGPERVQRSLKDAIHGALAMADLENARIAATCLGMTGSSETMREICTPMVPSQQILFGHDTKIALYSVTFGRPGVVVIGGTGAAAYGLTEAGSEGWAGGWGYLLGDEGSGYWIALRALNACCRATDGLMSPSLLLPLILQHLEVSSLQEVHHKVYSGSLSRPDIAALSSVVGRAASQGDATALRILREAGKELGQIVNAVIKKLHLQQTPVTVGAVGGVFRAGRFVLRTFRETVKETVPNVQIASPRVPAAVGAALMALEEIGIPLDDEQLGRIHVTLPHLGPVK